MKNYVHRSTRRNAGCENSSSIFAQSKKHPGRKVLSRLCLEGGCSFCYLRSAWGSEDTISETTKGWWASKYQYRIVRSTDGIIYVHYIHIPCSLSPVVSFTFSEAHSRKVQLCIASNSVSLPNVKQICVCGELTNCRYGAHFVTFLGDLNSGSVPEVTAG